MRSDIHKTTRQEKRKIRVRAKLHGTNARPRLHVFRSQKYTYLQAIDDDKGITVISASEKEITSGKTKTERSIEVSKLFVQKAKKAKKTTFVFDRGAYRYHGRVKAIAETLRSAGIKV